DRLDFSNPVIFATVAGQHPGLVYFGVYRSKYVRVSKDECSFLLHHDCSNRSRGCTGNEHSRPKYIVASPIFGYQYLLYRDMSAVMPDFVRNAAQCRVVEKFFTKCAR